MGKIIYTFSFLIFSLILNSCLSNPDKDTFNTQDEVVAPAQSKVKYNVVKIEDLYSMKIPAYMTVTDQLREDASLQYLNPFKEKYVIVLDEEIQDIMNFMEDYGVYDESKSKLDNYAEIRSNFFKESGNIIKSQTAFKSGIINGHSSISTTLDIDTPGIDEDITYYFTFIEGNEHYYMISSWTLFDRKDSFTGEVEVMTQSFSEL